MELEPIEEVETELIEPFVSDCEVSLYARAVYVRMVIIIHSRLQLLHDLGCIQISLYYPTGR